MKMNYNIEKDWIDETTGLRCVVVAHLMGYRCGYVGVTAQSKLYGLDYYNDKLNDICVHGGLTFSSRGYDDDYPVVSQLWWFGFDCAHAGDAKDESLISEQYKPLFLRPHLLSGTVRTLEYCINECEHLAKQLHNFKEEL
jgi:hypothetical protein